MIVAVDIDSTLADLTSVWLDRYNEDYQDRLSYLDLTKWAIHEFVKPECGTKIYNYLKDRSLYDEIEPYNFALETIELIRSLGHRVIFVTSTPPEGGGCKLLWLRRNGFLPEGNTASDYYECHDKSLIRADLLIDDGPHNIEAFPGKAILMERPWNESFEWPVRVVSWLEVAAGFKSGVFGPHPTELKRPLQVKLFREVTEKMYRTHLDKNEDYSPANIKATGELGLCTRAWDKMARLMNLTGFRFEVVEERFEAPKGPKNEPFDDSLLDLAVYCIIWWIYRKAGWGK